MFEYYTNSTRVLAMISDLLAKYEDEYFSPSALSPKAELLKMIKRDMTNARNIVVTWQRSEYIEIANFLIALYCKKVL